jgi:hypothetical protein
MSPPEFGGKAGALFPCATNLLVQAHHGEERSESRAERHVARTGTTEALKHKLDPALETFAPCRVFVDLLVVRATSPVAAKNKYRQRPPLNHHVFRGFVPALIALVSACSSSLTMIRFASIVPGDCRAKVVRADAEVLEPGVAAYADPLRASPGVVWERVVVP